MPDPHFILNANSSEYQRTMNVTHPLSDSVRKVLIVDDHPIVCAGLKQIIDHEADFAVCGTAENVNGGLEAIRQHAPDVVIVDLILGGDDGLQLIKATRNFENRPRLLVLSMHEERIFVERALRAGAQGYLTKLEVSEMVIVALRSILEDKIYLSPRVEDYTHLQGGGPKRADPVDDLSDRELQVFRLIGEGHGTRRISEELGVSIKTVESHRRNIKQKLGLTSATELVRHAVRWVEGEGSEDDD